MTARSSALATPAVRSAWIGPAGLFWLAVLVLSLFAASWGRDITRALDIAWAYEWPRAWTVPLARWISAFMSWLIDDATFGLFTFLELTRFVSWLLDIPLTIATSLLSTGFLRGQGSDAVQVLPALSWIAVIAVVVAMGYYARGWKLAAFVGACFLYLAVFGQWDSAMVTLSSIVIAVPFGVAGGLLLGIAGYRSAWVERALSPMLDIMQTVPVFAYLVPILFLFGFGPVAAMIATIVYAMPPMVRVTMLSLRGVPEEIRDFGRMAGCTRRQMTWKVLVPSARDGLMVGVNQVIMLSLNMVIIASMIGAGGLGYDVLTSLRRLDIGGGIEAGVAIVVLAIALDRLSQAFANRPPPAHAGLPTGYVRRHPWTTTVIAVILGTALVGLVFPPAQSYPEAMEVSTGSFWEGLVKYINVNFYDQLEAVKTVMLVNFLVPVKRFLTELPWIWTVGLVGIAGWQLGGWRLALAAVALAMFIVVTGQWEKAMITVYLCGISVVIASLIGIPLGIVAAENDRAGRILGGLVDTLQTLPSFVYLIPVVMLFRVGDFSAMIAVILYALAPAIRYTAHGIRQIDPQLVEAGVVSGCTRRQLLSKIKLPLALPEIMLGINQTIMLAISMVVITALVGTRDLGQEVYIALTKADTGRGIVAGLAVAFIAIIADRLVSAGARRTRHRLGLA
ncbi:ABC transporter permease [Microbaculum sp. FT89]|uniref:ABC transporter permease n=1 Tax=Microbaculum sp. FT89 TaxID=3447298 RepID=UPI003F53C0E6